MVNADDLTMKFFRSAHSGNSLEVSIMQERISLMSQDHLYRMIADDLFHAWKKSGMHEKILEHIQSDEFKQSIIDSVRDNMVKRISEQSLTVTIEDKNKPRD